MGHYRNSSRARILHREASPYARVVGKLTKKLQQRDIGLWGEKNLLDEAVSEPQAMTDLGDMVNPLCESLVKRLRERFPVNEAFWLNLMNVHLNYPSEVIKGKFINIKGKFIMGQGRL